MEALYLSGKTNLKKRTVSKHTNKNHGEHLIVLPMIFICVIYVSFVMCLFRHNFYL